MKIHRWSDGRCMATGSARGLKSRTCLAVEALESRVVLYSASGNAWPNPAAITISFMPDGTNLGGATSNLFSSFNSKPRLAGQWQAQVLKAAQAWAQQANESPGYHRPALRQPDVDGVILVSSPM
jgi:hypothetical protein